MAFNGVGVFVRLYNWVNDRNAGILIRADRMDAEMDGMATALTDCVTRDGQSPALADLPMATFKHTSVGNGTARNTYAAVGQLQDATVNWILATGTADAITAAYVMVVTALVDGQLCFFRATAANTTTTPTFSPDGLTARIITKQGGMALVAGDIPAANAEVVLRYNLANTRWELLNPASNIALGTGIATWLASPSSANLRAAVTDESGAGALLFSGGAIGAASATSLTFTSTSGIIGTTTNDSAAAGSVGEVIESEVLSGAAVSLTNLTPANVTSISLTAGNWIVWGNIWFLPNAATTVSRIDMAIGTTSATLPTSPGKGSFQTLRLAFITGAFQAQPTGQIRLSLASTTTVYLIANSSFGVNTMAAYGYIAAMRFR